MRRQQTPQPDAHGRSGQPQPIVRPELVPTAQESASPPANLISAMLADPGRAPERLALEAVRRCGPEAVQWVQTARRRYPQATTAELAMAVRTKFTRLSRVSGAATGALGLPGAAADACVIAWNKARMIVYLAALHDLDATHEQRAAEILYFTGAYKAIQVAQNAIQVAKRQAPVSSMLGARRRSAVAVLFSLGRMLGKSTVKRLITRAIPLGAIPVAAWSNGRSMTELADRVVMEYARRLGVVHHRALKP